jgi:regulator of sigma E protease
MSILIFLGVLFVLVLVHELGHFVVAKWTGMRVDEFGIGFPPKLFGIKKGETLYSINLLPIGGFVKIYGEDSVDTLSSPVSSEGRDRRSEALDEAGEGGEDSIRKSSSRSFVSKSKWAQSIVLLAGITMNILFAWLLVAVAFGIGVDGTVKESEAGPNARLTITGVLPQSPANKGALIPGSVIKSVEAGGDTLSVLSPTAFSSFVESHDTVPLTLVYTYMGEPRIVQITPEKGIINDAPDKAAIGVALSLRDTMHRSIGKSIVDSFIYIVKGIHDIVVGLLSLLYDALRFKADFSQIAGPVGIVGLVGEASAYGITTLLMFTAFISLNLAVINVFPFPALDGGRLMFVIIEAIKGSPITPKLVSTLNTVGFFVLIALMVAVTWNDVAKLFH